jgi:cytochrome c oxidase subunit III
MSASTISPVEIMPRELLEEPLPLNRHRGTLSMAWFIATEASLFAMLFAAYWYLGKDKPHWPMDDPPKLHYALIMLGVLAASSAILIWGERQITRRRYVAGQIALGFSMLLGLGFIVLSILEYLDHLKTLSPLQDSYGSIFYTITTLHGAHLTLGLLVLGYVLTLPVIEPTRDLPHQPYHNAALYWHFVDSMWLLIVIILYVIPNLGK